MKKLFITLLLFCFYVAQGAHGAMIIQQFTSGGGSCASFLDLSLADNDTVVVGSNTARFYAGFTWNSTTERTICQIDVKTTCEDGDITGKTFTARIWTADGVDLDTNVAISTNTISGAEWDDGGMVTFTFTGYTLLANTDYLITFDPGTVDVVNYGRIYSDTGDANADIDNTARWGEDKSRFAASASEDATVIMYAE